MGEKVATKAAAAGRSGTTTSRLWRRRNGVRGIVAWILVVQVAVVHWYTGVLKVMLVFKLPRGEPKDVGEDYRWSKVSSPVLSLNLGLTKWDRSHRRGT